MYADQDSYDREDLEEALDGESGRKACWDTNGMQVWGDVDTRSGSLGTSDYNAVTGRAGVEIDLGREKLNDCGRIVAGLFGYMGGSDIDASSGSQTGMDTLGRRRLSSLQRQ